MFKKEKKWSILLKGFSIVFFKDKFSILSDGLWYFNFFRYVFKMFSIVVCMVSMVGVIEI